jgi:hypothetical protein
LREALPENNVEVVLICPPVSFLKLILLIFPIIYASIHPPSHLSTYYLSNNVSTYLRVGWHGEEESDMARDGCPELLVLLPIFQSDL